MRRQGFAGLRMTLAVIFFTYKGVYMKLVIQVSLVALLSFSTGLHALQELQLHDAAIVKSLVTFKKNLKNTQPIMELVRSLSEDVQEEFHIMVDDLWCFFSKVHDYCMYHLKDSFVFQKYKLFKRTSSILTRFSMGIEEASSMVHEQPEPQLEDLQPFYNSLTPEQRIQWEQLIQELTLFFNELSIELDKVMGNYTAVQEEVKKALAKNNLVFTIQCGLEDPLPLCTYSF